MERKPYRCWVCDEIIWQRSDESVCEHCGKKAKGYWGARFCSATCRYRFHNAAKAARKE